MSAARIPPDPIAKGAAALVEVEFAVAAESEASAMAAVTMLEAEATAAEAGEALTAAQIGSNRSEPSYS